MRKHFVREPAMWSPCHHQQHFHFVHKLHRSSCDLAAASSWASAFSAGPLPPCPLALLVLLNSVLLCQKTIPGWGARHWAPSTPHSCLGDGIYQSAMYWFFSPTRLWVPLGAGTPCYIPLFPCLMLSLGNREFGQRPPLCSHVHYLFLSCALSASVVLALLLRPVCSIPIPAWSPRCLLCSWRGILSLNSSHGFSSQPSETAFPSLCPFTTVCHYTVDHIRFIKYVLIHHHNSSLIMVLVSVFLCLVGWLVFFFPLLYFLHCCVTPTALNSTQ